MKLHKFALVILASCVLAYDEKKCKYQSASQFIKHSTFDFSIKLLQRVAEDTVAHFVFSPLSTWLQVTALSEGATGKSFKQIWNITRPDRHKCFKKKIYEYISLINRKLKINSNRKSIIVIDKLVLAKKKFVKEVQRIFGIKVLLLNFQQTKSEASAAEVNKVVEQGTGDRIRTILYYDDFNSTKLLLADANCFHSEWQTEFYKGYTEKKPFYSSSRSVIGEVNMMHHTGYYYLVDIPYIGAQVLEMPLGIQGVSMLIFLPTDKTWIGELFYSLEKTKLTFLFKLFAKDNKKIVNVAIPKFKQLTEIENIPELLFDMGIKRIFDPHEAELRGISKYNIHASLMTQISKVKVDEKGVSGDKKSVRTHEPSLEFNANRPFVYIVVDKETEYIMYAGAYSIPSRV